MPSASKAQSHSHGLPLLKRELARPLRIAITTGEPAGIGPELMYSLTRCNPCELPLLARIAQDKHQTRDIATVPVELILIGSHKLLIERMSIYGKEGSDFCLHKFQEDTFQASFVDNKGCGHVSYLNVALKAPSLAGHLDVTNAPYVLKTLDCAIELCQKGIVDAIVTAPISKSVICQSGLSFTGHTEYLQEKTETDEVVMMLGCAKFNVALVTTHLPLQEVSKHITKKKLSKVIQVLHTDLEQRMGFKHPIIYVCGLNPHAGEAGTLGYEELETIIPVLEELRLKGMDLRGPYPADTIFQKKYLNDASAILTMYHDQGLPVLKYAGFDEGYNTTLGLPFIRTSVDHGTALDLAGKGVADPGSLQSAVSLAIYMAQQRHK